MQLLFQHFFELPAFAGNDQPLGTIYDDDAVAAPITVHATMIRCVDAGPRETMNISRFQSDRQTEYFPDPGRRLDDFEFSPQPNGIECGLFQIEQSPAGLTGKLKARLDRLMCVSRRERNLKRRLLQFRAGNANPR